MDTFSIGKQAEQRAEKFLCSQGLSLLKRNYTVDKRGEIDLIMRDQAYYVFVEVKWRQREDYGDVMEMITPQKQSRVIYAAKCYLLEHNLYETALCRFDAIGITPEKNHEIRWIKDAFWVKY